MPTPSFFAFRAKSSEECIGRVVDSGASSHFSGDLSLFSGPLTPCHVNIGGIAGGLLAVGHGSGHVVISNVRFDLSHLYYVPGLSTTLLSMHGLVEDGVDIRASKVTGSHVMSLRAPNGATAHVTPVNGLYPCMPSPPSSSSPAAFLSVGGVSIGRTNIGRIPLGDLVHRRLGHASWGNKHLASRLRSAFGDTSLGSGHSTASCDACCKTKAKQVFSRAAPTRPIRRPLERVHADFVPSLPTLGVGGFVGFLLIVDEFTDHIFTYPIRSKSELPLILESFRVHAERHFRERMGTVSWPTELASIRTDGEPVCVSDAMRAWCADHNIKHELCAPYCQWQNGKAERAIQTVWQGAEAMRVAAGAPPSFWVYCVAAFVRTRNVLAMGAHPLSPWERWNLAAVPLRLRIAPLRVWGTLCYRFVPTYVPKLQWKSSPCVFLGYSTTSKCYLVRDMATHVVHETPNVTFNEAVYPLRRESWAAFLRAQHNEGRGAASSSAVLPVFPWPSATQSPTGTSPAVPAAASGPDPVLPAPASIPEALPGHADGPPPLEPPLVDGPSPLSLPDSSPPSSPGPSPPPSQPAGRPVRTKAVPAKNREFYSRVLPDLFDPHPAVAPSVRTVASAVPSGSSSAPAPDAPPVAPFVQVALCAALLAVPPAPPIMARANGQVVVPRLCASVASRFRLSKLAHAPGLTNHDAARIATLAQRHVWGPSGVVPVPRHGGPGPSPLTDPFHAAMLADVSDPPCWFLSALLAKAASTCDPSPFSQFTPTNVDEAMNDINSTAWQDAMQTELNAMESFGVWELCTLPPGATALANKWVFRIKRDKLGIVEKLKARLTLAGYRQVKGRDYDETWAPTGNLRSFRALIAEAAGDASYHTAQWDVTAAFLHAYIDKPVYMQQPPGHARPGQEHYVCRLIKALYGAKQSSHLFYKLVRDTLLGFGAIPGITVARSKADTCLYLVSRGSEVMRVLTHADDFAVTYNSESLYATIFAAMQKTFSITDYGRKPITFYCGIGVHRAPDGSFELSQTSYINEVVDRLGLAGLSPVHSPEKTGAKAKLRPLRRTLTPSEAAFMKGVPYLETVGALWYIARASRFDIFRGTQECAIHASNPGPEHWAALVRIVRYLATTADDPLVFRCGEFTDPALHRNDIDVRLVGHSDADWAGDPDTSKSRTGWLVHLAGCLVSWRSVVQSSVSQSSCEAEYVAAAALANELVWWRMLCADLGYPMRGPTPIRCDSEAAVGLAKHPGSFEATKHIRLRYHVLRELQDEGQIRVVWCTNRHQWADALTKNVAIYSHKRITKLCLGQKFVPAIANSAPQA